MPVSETQAGKGSLAYDHAQNVGAIGATGTSAANHLAREADLVIGIGTRYRDFTTASMTAFQNPNVRFVNINVAEFDAYKASAIPVVADARVALEEMAEGLRGYRVPRRIREENTPLREEWRRRCIGCFIWKTARCWRRARSSARCRDVGSSRRHGFGRRRAPGGSSQALATRNTEQLSYRIWLLLHGLRDSRRHRREAGRPIP